MNSFIIIIIVIISLFLSFYAPFFSRDPIVRSVIRASLFRVSSSFLRFCFLGVSVRFGKFNPLPRQRIFRVGESVNNRGSEIFRGANSSFRFFWLLQKNTKDKLALVLSRYAVVNFYYSLSCIGVIQLHLSL